MIDAQNKKKIAVFSIISAVIIIAVIIIVVVSVNLSGIFRTGKVSQINLGDTKSQVVEILGEPDEYTETVYYYYSGSYSKILKEIESLDGDDAAEQRAELYEELESITYKRIDITFSDDAVTSVYFNASCCDSQPISKTLKSASVLSGNFIQYSTNTTVTITYEAKFKDGSYVKNSAEATREGSGIIAENTGGITSTWSDKWCKQYSEEINIKAVETASGYYLDGTTLYITTDDSAYLTRLTTDQKNSITELVITGSVTEVPFDSDSYTSLFKGWTSLKSVTIGGSVKSFGYAAFKNCNTITEVIIGSGVTTINADAFSGCTSLTEIVIPDSVTSIGNTAFYNCKALTSVTLSNSLISIGSSAFRGCSALKSLIIPESVTYIDGYAFQGCYALKSVTFENTSGWNIQSTSSTKWTAVVVTSDTQNATYLTTTYYAYSWKRTDN